MVTHAHARIHTHLCMGTRYVHTHANTHTRERRLGLYRAIGWCVMQPMIKGRREARDCAMREGECVCGLGVRGGPWGL